MKKIVLVLALALGLGGCAQLQHLQTALELGTTSVANPVTKERLAAIENGAIVVFAGLNVYKQSCQRLLLPQSCRGVVASIQVYTRQIPPQLARLRTFVRNNDQVNAASAYNFIVETILSVKTIAGANNIQMGGA